MGVSNQRRAPTTTPAPATTSVRTTTIGTGMTCMGTARTADPGLLHEPNQEDENDQEDEDDGEDGGGITAEM